jgi:hypothetical protein
MSPDIFVSAQYDQQTDRSSAILLWLARRQGRRHTRCPALPIGRYREMIVSHDTRRFVTL